MREEFLFVLGISLVVLGIGCNRSTSGNADGGQLDGTNDGADCKPATCAELGVVCGIHPDDCVGAIDCGRCRWEERAQIGSRPSIDIASDGSIHLVYLENGVTYGRYQTGISIAEMLDDTIVPPNTPPEKIEIVALADGSVHLAYSSDLPGSDPNEVRYAVRGPSGWNVQVVGGGSVPDLAIRDGTPPHLAYIAPDLTDGMVKHAVWETDHWVTSDVPLSSFGKPSACAIALDRDGVPHIAIAVDGIRLDLASWSGTQWVTQGVSNRWFRESVDLAFGEDNQPRITGPALDDNFYLLSRQADGWVETRLPGDAVAGVHGLALGPGDMVHVVASERDGLFYWGGYAVQFLEPFCTQGFADIAVDASNRPHIVYDCPLSSRYVWPAGAFSQSYEETCDNFAVAVCAKACPCRSGGDCCWNTSHSSSCCGPESTCPGVVRADFCSDPFADPADIEDCYQALDAEAECVSESLSLPAACDAIRIN